MPENDDFFAGFEETELPGEDTGTTSFNSYADDDNFFGEPTPEEKGDDLLTELLKAKGITDSTIKILDEQENEQEVSFYDLSRQEQIDILNSEAPSDEGLLEDTEIDLLNHLRTNNLSVNAFLEQYKQAILDEVNTNVIPNYEIDNYDNEELFLMDLKNKFDLTDEELQTELEKELANPVIFEKKTTKLREEYKQLEDQYETNKQLEIENTQREEYNAFVNTMTGISSKSAEYHGVYLDPEEKVETLNYLIKLDDQGMSQFSKDLNDPSKLYQAAWYLRYGKEAFQALENAYEAEIRKLKQVKPSGIVRKPANKINHINDL